MRVGADDVEWLFLDTNILVYAYDRDAGEKRSRAKVWLRDFWQGQTQPHLSVQVLQEFHVTLVRKGYPVVEAAALVSDFLSWPVVANTVGIFQRALLLQQRYQVSFWDASIIAAARSVNCKRVWSEDLSAGQDYDGVVVENPFAATP